MLDTAGGQGDLDTRPRTTMFLQATRVQLRQHAAELLVSFPDLAVISALVADVQLVHRGPPR